MLSPIPASPAGTQPGHQHRDESTEQFQRRTGVHQHRSPEPSPQRVVYDAEQLASMTRAELIKVIHDQQELIRLSGSIEMDGCM